MGTTISCCKEKERKSFNFKFSQSINHLHLQLRNEYIRIKEVVDKLNKLNLNLSRYSGEFSKSVAKLKKGEEGDDPDDDLNEMHSMNNMELLSYYLNLSVIVVNFLNFLEESQMMEELETIKNVHSEGDEKSNIEKNNNSVNYYNNTTSSSSPKFKKAKSNSILLVDVRVKKNQNQQRLLELDEKASKKLVKKTPLDMTQCIIHLENIFITEDDYNVDKLKEYSEIVDDYINKNS